MTLVDVIALFTRTFISLFHVRILVIPAVPLGASSAASCLVIRSPGTMCLSVTASLVADGARGIGILVDGMHWSHVELLEIEVVLLE